AMTALPAGVMVYVKGDLFAPKKAKKKKKDAEQDDEEAADEDEEDGEAAAAGDDDFELSPADEFAETMDMPSDAEVGDDTGAEMEVSDFLDQSSVDEQEMMVMEEGSSSETEAMQLEDFEDDFEEDIDPKKKKKK